MDLGRRGCAILTWFPTLSTPYFFKNICNHLIILTCISPPHQLLSLPFSSVCTRRATGHQGGCHDHIASMENHSTFGSCSGARVVVANYHATKKLSLIATMAIVICQGRFSNSSAHSLAPWFVSQQCSSHHRWPLTRLLGPLFFF